jgi:3,4-dihydroxy 2-butanone 4-phosphate synthase / GTP cyclohydrolase II
VNPAGAADDRVRATIDAVAAGRPVVLVDADRNRGGSLVFAAVHASSSLLAFTVRHTSGFVYVALTPDDCERLALPPMEHHEHDDARQFRVTVDRRDTGTGISASSRAMTIAALGAPESVADDFVRPGHVVPVMAQPGGVLYRAGHTEAAVDLARLAGLPPAGAFSAIIAGERISELASGDDLEVFAAKHNLAIISVSELVDFRRRTEPQVKRSSATTLTTPHGDFRVLGYTSEQDGSQHMAILTGTLEGRSLDSVPVYVHVECLTGDVLGSGACACRGALDDAMARFASDGGVILYIRPAGDARACGLFVDPGNAARAAVIAEWILTDLRRVFLQVTQQS